MEGLIIKAISGFYYVESEGSVYECKARGIFRKKGISPAVGDRAEISVIDGDKAQVENILPRKNYLVRPPLANLDRLFIISSAAQPSPNTFIIDKICAVAVSKDIEPILIFTKTDLENADELADIYRRSGFRAFTFSADNDESREEVLSLLSGKISAFTGNTGVGKSTLLNKLMGLSIETGEISRKLGRGRHTTRQSELYPVCGGYVADTPGFSTMDIERYEIIRKDDLASCFPDFEKYRMECRFTGCAHICEKGCAVIEAVNDGKIMPSRHRSYVQMYNEVKDIPEYSTKLRSYF